MKQALIKKTAVINEILDKVKKAESLVVLEYTQLKVSDLQSLRRILRQNDSELKIYKNSLVNYALKDSKYKDLGEYLIGQNAFVFGYKDQLAPAKLSADFAKLHKTLILKAGIYNKNVIDKNELNIIASLPSKDELYASIAMLLKQPIIKLALTIKEIANINSK